jgi:hypothetical protein
MVRARIHSQRDQIHGVSHVCGSNAAFVLGCLECRCGEGIAFWILKCGTFSHVSNMIAKPLTFNMVSRRRRRRKIGVEDRRRFR